MKVAAHRNVSNLSSKYSCFIKYNDYIEPIKLILQLINKISNKLLISLKSSITIMCNFFRFIAKQNSF